MGEQGLCYDRFKDHLKIMDFIINFTKNIKIIGLVTKLNNVHRAITLRN